MREYNSRDEIPNEYKIDLTNIFKNQEDHDNTIKTVYDNLDKMSLLINNISKNNILDFLRINTITYTLIKKLMLYSEIIKDLNINAKQEDERKIIDDVYKKHWRLFGTFNNIIESMDINDYNQLFNDSELTIYKSKLDRIRNKIFRCWFSSRECNDRRANIINSFGTIGIIDGIEIPLTVRSFSYFSQNPDKRIRMMAYNMYLSKYQEHAEEFADIYNQLIQKNNEDAKNNGYESVIDAKLSQDGVPKDVLDNIMKYVNEDSNYLRKYMNLTKHLLNLEDFDYCDLLLNPLDNSLGEYSIDSSKNICINALQVLGDDYIKHFNKILDEHLIDYYPCKGKSVNSFNNMNGGLSVVVLNFKNDFDSLKTMIHECGHNVHSQYIIENNIDDYVVSNRSICEVPSIVNEFLLSQYLYNNSQDNNEKMSAIISMLKIYDSWMFGGARSVNIQLEWYDYAQQGNKLDANYLTNLTRKWLDLEYGDTINKNDYYGLLWARRSPYLTAFYDMSYLISVIIASYIVSEINKGNKDIIDNYIKFLSCGSDKNLVDTLQVLGIDVYDKNVYISAVERFNSLVDELERIKDEVRINGK